MNISLEQARVLDAVVRHGSFAKAAKALNKVHSAVVYSLKTLEDAAGVPLLDRSGYRTTLTPLGERALELCRRLLETEEALGALCRAAQTGFEPYLKVVFDGLLPVDRMMRAVRAVGLRAPTTRVFLYSEFLQEVEARYERERADVMVGVLPPAESFRTSLALGPLKAFLVGHREHAQTFLTVRGSDQRLRMSTSVLEKASVFRLSDFHAKKAALLLGMGYGWMPEYLVEAELASGELEVLKWGPEKGVHVFEPVLYCRETSVGGKACAAMVEALKAELGS